MENMWKLLLFICHLQVIVLADTKYKLCIAQRMAKFNQQDSCEQLKNNSHSGVECIIAKDRLECLHLLNEASVDFTVLHPEELVVANQMGIPLRVTHELQKFKNVPNVDYSIIGLISSRVSVESLSDLRNLQMCSVGFDVEKGHDFDWNEIFSKFIEDQVVQQQCHVNVTLVENRIASLESYFGPSCKAGKWVPDPKEDLLLKQKYPDLCALCDDPITCSVKDKYWGRRGAPLCMTDCLGDVAWMRLDDWRLHEKTVTNKACSEFFFLCPDGSVQLTSIANPCVWVSQPLPTLVVRPALSQVLTHFLTEVGTSLPSSEPMSSWRWVTRNLISPYTRYITQLENEFTPNYFLAKATNYLTASEDESGCDYSHHVIRFCTDSGLDRSKCDQLAHIARAYGVVPDIECVSPSQGHTNTIQGHGTSPSQDQDSSQAEGAMRSSDTCAQMLSRGEADLMSVRTDKYADVLRSDSHLRPILYQLGEQQRYAVAVTKKSSRITSFAQLRNKRACFGMVNDLGWNAALYQLLRENLLPRVCPYEEAMKQYFGEICAIYAPHPSVIRQCDGNAEEGRSMSYEQKEVMECLSEGGGDVVFLDLKNINVKREHEWYFRNNAYALSTLCPPGSLHAPSYRHDVNSSCYLLWSSQGQLLIPDNMTDQRAGEIANMMAQIGAYFGETVKTLGTPAESLKLFAKGWDGVEDVLFQDDTRSFSPAELMYTSPSGVGRVDKPLSRNYEHVLPLFARCDPNQNLLSPSTGSITSPAMMLTIALLCLLLS